jgi:hypothetical protein
VSASIPNSQKQPLNLQLNITEAFRTGDYSKKSVPLLHHYMQLFKEKKCKRLHFPTHVDPMSVDFEACTLCYGEFYEPCQILLPNLMD